jgi:hypothetical protein
MITVRPSQAATSPKVPPISTLSQPGDDPDDCRPVGAESIVATHGARPRSGERVSSPPADPFDLDDLGTEVGHEHGGDRPDATG